MATRQAGLDTVRKVDAIVIAGAVVTVSGALVLTLWAGLGLRWPQAAIAGMATAVTLAVLASRSTRTRRPAIPDPSPAPAPAASAEVRDTSPDPVLLNRIESIENGLRTVARRCYELDQRLGEIDRDVARRTHDTVKAVASELSMVGTLVRDLAEAVAIHDAELFGEGARPDRRATQKAEAPPVQPPRERIVPNAPAPRATTRTAADLAPAPLREPPSARAPESAAEIPPPAQPPAATAAQASPPESQPTAAPAPPETSHAVRKALVTGGVDLYLQSVVTLPQRKVRLYEALGRVRETDGSFAEADAVAAAAARLGLTVKLETDLFRSVCKVASHLAARERDVPVICPVSLSTLRDATYFAAVATAVEADRQIPVRVLLQIRHAEIARPGVLEGEAIDALRGLGFRFAVDAVEDLRLDARGLADRGVRYVKVPADLLLSAQDGEVPTEIHPADIADLFARQGITLVAGNVTSEAVALEVQEFSAPLAQGSLFSGPRPVRGEVLRTDPPAPAAASTDAKDKAAGTVAAAAGDRRDDVQARPERLPFRAFLRRTAG